MDLDPALEVAGLDAREQIEFVSSGPKAIARKAAEIRRERKARKLDNQTGNVSAATEVTSAVPVSTQLPANIRPEDYPVRALLADPARFDQAVRLWQDVKESMVRNGILPFAADDPLFMIARHSPIFDLINEVRMAAPPNDWPLCFSCKGSGKASGRTECCAVCEGGGFQSKRIPLACDLPAEIPAEMMLGSGDPAGGAEADRTGGRRRRFGRHRPRLITADGEEPI